jgi:osmotically-inducible protein OsmY
MQNLLSGLHSKHTSFRVVVSAALAALLVSALPAVAAQKAKPKTPAEAEVRLGEEVHHILVTEPFYTLFDILGYKVEGATVTLTGQVSRPTLKIDAVRDVRGIRGVETVNDQIEVLPNSPNDDRIRRAEYRAIYSAPGMEKYAIQALPPIHIIVKNGHVTLIGTVLDEADKTMINMRALGVHGAFSVDNELKVERK